MRKELSGLKDHYILCGLGRAAKPVADGLAHKDLPFCVIEMNPANEPLLQDLGWLYLIDDATSDEALEDAGVKNAKAVLTLLPSDADNLFRHRDREGTESRRARHRARPRRARRSQAEARWSGRGHLAV